MTTVREARAAEARAEALGNAPEVGQLIRNGRTLFYAYVNGTRIERWTRFELGQALAVAYDHGASVGA